MSPQPLAFGFRRACRREPRWGWMLYLYFCLCLGAGSFVPTLACCARPVVRADADRPEALLILLEAGEIAEAEADVAKAGEAYARAIDEFRDYAAAWSSFGEYLHFWRHDLPGAKISFERALAAPHADARAIAFAWRGIGAGAYDRGDRAAALMAFERSLKVLPLADTHRSLSSLYATEYRDFAKAAVHARAAVDLVPDDAIGHMQLAVQYVRAGEAAHAAESFRRALEIADCDERGVASHPIHCCVLYNGACYHAVRRDEESAIAMLRAFFATPNHRHISRAEILADPDFEYLRDSAGFRELIGRYLPQ